ncbi:MAG TPA: hypothetical protein VI636_16835 [Candidatus Angelobacter sp.]
MHWISDPAAGQRPVVIVEDKPRHVSTLVTELGNYREELTGLITIVCLAEGHGDTASAVGKWLANDLDLHVRTLPGPATADLKKRFGERCGVLDPQITQDMESYAREFRTLLRPGGLLLQDVVLNPLRFTEQDKWKSVYAAGQVRSLLMPRGLQLWFMTNKSLRVPHVLRAKEDVKAEEFFDKEDHLTGIVSSLRRFLKEHFPWRLHLSNGRVLAIGMGDDDDVSHNVDIVVWATTKMKRTVGGRLIQWQIHAKSGKPGLRWRPPLSNVDAEAVVPALVSLVRDRVNRGPGLPTTVFGRIPNLAEGTDLQKLARSQRAEAKRGEMQNYHDEAAKLAERVRAQLTGDVLDKTVPPKAADGANPNEPADGTTVRTQHVYYLADYIEDPETKAKRPALYGEVRAVSTIVRNTFATTGN